MKLSDLEKILSFIPIEKASVYFSIDENSGFDDLGITQLANEISQATKTSVSLIGTEIRGSIYCQKQDVLRLYSEWFNSEIDMNKNLEKDFPQHWQGRKTLKIERINFQDLNTSTGGALIDLNLLNNIIEVKVSGKNLDYIAKIQKNTPTGFKFRYQHC